VARIIVIGDDARRVSFWLGNDRDDTIIIVGRPAAIHDKCSGPEDSFQDLRMATLLCVRRDVSRFRFLNNSFL
jgi:hypothetical protein